MIYRNMKVGINQTHIVGLSTQFIIVLYNVLSRRDELGKYDSFYLIKNDGVRDISRTNFNNLNMPHISDEKWNGLKNWWSSFLDQSEEGVKDIINIDLYGFHSTPESSLPLYDGMDSNKHDLYKKLRDVQKEYFPWSPDLIKKVNNEISKLGIDENTLGVHLRLSDMTKNSKYDGIVNRANTMEEYVKCTKHALNENPNIDKIFVMGENENLIAEFKTYFDLPVLNYEDCLLGTLDNEDGVYKEQSTFILDAKYWFDTYVDILISSKCHTFLASSSSVSQNVIIFNEVLKRLYYTNDLKNKL